MSREEALEIVRQLEEAVNAHDTHRLASIYADVAVTVSPVFSGIAGRDDIAKSWDAIFSLFPDWSVKVDNVLVDGDRIAFMGTAGGTDQNGWFGQPATGERIDYRAIIVLTMAHGKIARDERIYDLSGILQRLEKVRLDKELTVAVEVQRALLPNTRHSTTFCEAVGDSIPCRSIGGDFFEMVHLEPGDFAVALGDVGGKGPASALVAATIQGMLAVEVENRHRPAEILANLNRQLFRRGIAPRFATLFLGALSPTGRFVYANAGHNSPIVLTRNGFQRLTIGGTILGAFSESTFEEGTVALSEGDSMIMFSDGVTEASDIHDQEFGEDRLLSYLAAVGDDAPTSVLRGILGSVREFCDGAAQSDDITAAVIRFHRS